MKIDDVYQLSRWTTRPGELGFMEKDMIKGGIKYGIVKRLAMYSLVREDRGLKPETNLITVEFDRWYKAFKKRDSL